MGVHNRINRSVAMPLSSSTTTAPCSKSVITKQCQKRYHESDGQNAKKTRNPSLTLPEEQHRCEVSDLVPKPTFGFSLAQISQSHDEALFRSAPREDVYDQLFCASVEAKVWGVAARSLRLQSPPVLFPEYTKPGENAYVYRDSRFWTSGFFPGCLYLLLERRRKYDHVLTSMTKSSLKLDTLHLEYTLR